MLLPFLLAFLVWICAFTLNVVNRDEQDPPSAAPSLPNCSHFLQEHVKVSHCVPTVKKKDSNVGREIYNLFSNILLLWAMQLMKLVD